MAPCATAALLADSALITQLGSCCAPFCRPAMSSTPTVSSATPTTGPTFSATASPSQSSDSNNGGPSSSLYLYAISEPNRHFAHFFFYFFYFFSRSSRTRGLVALFGSPLYVRIHDTHRFTFLATLFLLLFVSSAIILRSFILRRRFRRRIEEAILAGVIPPPQTGRVSRRRVIGEKPKLWEARVHPAPDVRWDAIVVRFRFSFLVLFLNF